MKLSICVAYYNRPEFLRRTLQAYYNSHGSEIQDCEFVIIDDGSNTELLAEPVVNEFKDRLNTKTFYRTDKDDLDPAVAINMSVNMASSDLILITCPETMPGTPFIKNILNRDIQDDEYLMIPCYSVSQEFQKSINLLDLCDKNYTNNVLNTVKIIPKSHTVAGGEGWYSHPIYRPTLFYFCSILKKRYFLEMDGIDEDFRYGWGYEDTDFTRRLLLRNPKVTWLESEICFHQNHYNGDANRNNTIQAEGLALNMRLYEEKKKLNKWKVY